MKKKATKKTQKKKSPKKSAKKSLELDTAPFEIHRDRTTKYLLYWWSLVIGGINAGVFLIVGAIFGLIYAVTFGRWLAPRQSEALKYWLDESGLHANQGVFFIKFKTIPYDKITDIVLSQGPLLRACGIWQINIETAGSNQQISEAVLLGLKDPEGVKARIISAREAFRR